MAGDRDLVGREGGGCLLYSWYNTALCIFPGLPEAGMCSAAGTNFGDCGTEIQVRAPRIDGLGATERYDDELVGMVNRNETRYVGRGLLPVAC
jgi:hypothetical protein